MWTFLVSEERKFTESSKKKKLLKQNDWHGGVIGNIRIFFCLSALWIDDFFVSSYCVRRWRKERAEGETVMGEKTGRWGR